MKTYLLVMLMFGGCVGDISSKCSIHSGIKWYDIQAVFDALDPCTPNPCEKGHVCRINDETYQHYCEVCKPKNRSKVENEPSCKHISSFENFLLMSLSGFYRALPLLRQLPSERLNRCPNVNGLPISEIFGSTGTATTNRTTPTKIETPPRTITTTTSGLKDPCKSNPCQNRGRCLADLGAQDYYCLCPNTHSGKFCEEPVMDEFNRIRMSGFRATQMNDYGSAYIADRAIDGDLATFTATAAHGNNPWWQIDFQQLYGIIGLTVVNRHDCCPERLHDFEVRIGNRSMTSTNAHEQPNELCHLHRGAGILDGDWVDIYCKHGSIVGRYLTIQIVEKCTNYNQPHCASEGDILSMAEVRLYGKIHTRF